MYFDRNISENKDGKKMRAVHNLSCVTNGEFHFNIINFNANQIESTYIRNLHIFIKRKSYNPNFSNCRSIFWPSFASLVFCLFVFVRNNLVVEKVRKYSGFIVLELVGGSGESKGQIISEWLYLNLNQKTNENISVFLA